ncbi:MAG TPA: hypothetical protein VHZ03_49130 [Trebonia sp.]|jgi:hypothetical protein|nr:hypothetical protein [Trebonia sp.]
MGQARTPGAGELRRALREQAGFDLAALVPAKGGESASTFLATGRDGAVSVLKVSPGATGDSIGRLRDLVARLRRRGYPAARLLASGQAGGMTFWHRHAAGGIHPTPWLEPLSQPGTNSPVLPPVFHSFRPLTKADQFTTIEANGRFIATGPTTAASCGQGT